MSYPREMEIYPQQQAPQYSTIYVEEDDVPAMRAFSTKSRRMAFVRKVLSVVMLQLLVCASLTAGCVLSSWASKIHMLISNEILISVCFRKPTKLWIHKNYFIAFIAGYDTANWFFIISALWLLSHTCIYIHVCNDVYVAEYFGLWSTLL